MRNKALLSVAIACMVLYSPIAMAQPAMVDGGSKDFSADDLTCRIDIFNANDFAKFSEASTVTVYHSDKVLDSDEYAELCDALAPNPAVTRLRNAIKADAGVSKWFQDNGIEPDSAILMVNNGNGKFDLYLQ